MTKKEIEKEMQRNFELGKVVALSDLPDEFLNLAANHFKMGDDGGAKLLRNLAEDFKLRLATARGRYDENYPKEQQREQP